MRPTRPVSSDSSRSAPASGCSPKSMPPPGSVHEPGRSVMLLSRHINSRDASSTHTLYAATRCTRGRLLTLRSSAVESRVALLAERGHAFHEVGRRGREGLEVAFELERMREVGFEGRVQQTLREAQ